MTYYRFGQRLAMTRAVARAMARSSTGARDSQAMEQLIQRSKSRFGRAVTRPLMAAVATYVMDAGGAFSPSSEFLYFDGDDDDGT
ncbi:unnamed protein product [Hyaloperonospora brassicae]|uniref:Uncharacterized protein n=1 Tax=Hyaloperonospora brassicae TaxID=162125 RepID=A0AAV0UUT6_HYABA|nr:unnamed protein product [Hyaloperonospora brassicae]